MLRKGSIYLYFQNFFFLIRKKANITSVIKLEFKFIREPADLRAFFWQILNLAHKNRTQCHPAVNSLSKALESGSCLLIVWNKNCKCTSLESLSTISRSCNSLNYFSLDLTCSQSEIVASFFHCQNRTNKTKQNREAKKKQTIYMTMWYDRVSNMTVVM